MAESIPHTSILPPGTVTVQKLAIRADYQPSLAVYTRMDSVAMLLASEFPHWERSALSIELRNPVSHRRFQMVHDHCYFECDSPEDPQEAVAAGIKLIDTALRKFEINKVGRMGIAHFFVGSTTKSFQDLVIRVDKKLHAPFETIPVFDDYRLMDVAYVLNVESRDGKWAQTVQAGPMTRNEFWSKYSLNPRLYDIEHQSIESHKSVIPETFVFLSVDSGCNRIDRQYAILNLPSEASRVRTLAEGLYAYITE